MKWITNETIEEAVRRIDKEMAKETGNPVGSYLDWLEDQADNYRSCYDPLDPDYEEWVINDLENEADKFIDFWKEQYLRGLFLN